MAIYLDYIRSPELDDIIFLSLLDDDGSQHDFMNDDLDDVESFLTQEVDVITYERPFMHLVPHFDEDEIEEHEMRKHYIDLFRFLKKQTGFEIALSRLAEGMLGLGPQSIISKLPSDDITIPDSEVQSNVHERLRAIRDIHQAMLTTGFVIFYYKGVLHSREVDIDEFD